MSTAEVASIITAAGGVIAVLVRNTWDIYRLKKYACYRYPCPNRITNDELDALQSKSSEAN